MPLRMDSQIDRFFRGEPEAAGPVWIKTCPMDTISKRAGLRSRALTDQVQTEILSSRRVQGSQYRFSCLGETSTPLA